MGKKGGRCALSHPYQSAQQHKLDCRRRDWREVTFRLRHISNHVRQREICSMNKLTGTAMAGLLVAMVAVPVFADRAQDELEENLSVGFGESDVITDTTPPKPYVPFRYRNSLPKFQWLLDKYGWTTNQLIDFTF